MTNIDPRLVLRALPEVGTWQFEKFGEIFYGSLQDREFVPLGGMHDGGAEGFDSDNNELEPETFFDEGGTNFLQISKEATVRSKIRRTVKRLREYGRDPRVLTYLSSQVIPDIDKEERLLSDELGCRIRIRDGNFIEVNINATPAIQAAFHAYLEPAIEFLYKPGAADVGERTEEYVDRTLAVFLRQEVDNRRDKSGLLESIADSLILWALGETDPDKGIFMTREQMLERIEQTLPAAKQFIHGVLDDRLEMMVQKDVPGGRQIRFYRNEKKYCLPYETRQLVAAENADDDMLKSQVTNVFLARLEALSEEDTASIQNEVVSVCHSSLEGVFERQGLQMAQFVTDGDGDDELYTDVSKILSSIVDRVVATSEDKGRIRRYCLMILRDTFYKSTPVEHEYLLKLSRTYILLLTLKNEPRIVEYFRTLEKSFRLYIGTDFIIRAISEQYLAPEDRATVNLLDILREAGSELILTEKAVEEVETHLRAQILEFENHYAMLEHRIPLELVGYIDRLLIRAYLYSKLAPAEGIPSPAGWRSYIGQFANYGEIKSLTAKSQIAGYFIRRFKMSYETNDEMLVGIDKEELEQISDGIYKIKQESGHAKAEGKLLAYNDALHILRVFQKRIEFKEGNPGNHWGFQTWWLTQDGKVRRAGAPASAARSGAHFMMRPEFLLSNISFAPELKQVRDSYEKIFPTVLGVRLSARLSQGVFENVMREAKEVSTYDDARAGTMITELTNKLKGDALRIYEIGWHERV